MSFRSYDLLRLVRDFGETLTLKKTTSSGTYDPATGTVSGAATTNYSFDGYLYNVETMVPDQVVATKLRCVVPALGLVVEPNDEDVITKGSKNYVITHVVTIFSSGSAVCYLCHLED